jgi:long-chain acyl-CoA synthetase
METNSFVNTSMLTVLPMFHGFGLGLSAHNMLISGGSCTLIPRFNVKQTVKLIKKNRVNYIVGVPTLYEALLKNKQFTKLKELKYIKQTFVGGDFTTQSLKDRFNKVLKDNGSKARLLEGYGLTETVAVNCINRASDEKINSVGKPIQGYKVKIIDVNTNKQLKPNQAGEICVNCSTTMKGYLNDPQTTKQVLETDNEGHIWVHTGDFGYLDEDGYLYMKSRLKRIIKVSGVQVFPSEIENLVSSMEEIDKACAVGMEDEKKGCVIKLYVSLKENYQTSEELTTKIMKLCKENLIVYAIPKRIIYLDKMPLTNFNKIDYRSLEQQMVK